MYGPSGCGKTMLARAAAVELREHAAFFHVRAGDVLSKFYGEPQRRILALEELVREAGHHQATTNAMLAWMDGMGTGSERVFFLGATNRPEAIDEAALRRFGDAVEVGLPCAEARSALLRRLAVVKAGADGHRAELADSDLDNLAARTEGFSLADVDAWYVALSWKCCAHFQKRRCGKVFTRRMSLP